MLNKGCYLALSKWCWQVTRMMALVINFGVIIAEVGIRFIVDSEVVFRQTDV